MEISGPAPLGTKAAYALPVQDARPVAIHRIDPKPATSDAGAEARQHPDQNAPASVSRDIPALSRAVAQGQRPAGPPPSFEVSLLEVESDLKQKLARMEAERTQERDSPAVQGPPEAGPAPEPTADPAPVEAKETPEPPVEARADQS